MKKVVIIGAGPAGMTAAYSASQNGIDVVLVEKNERVEEFKKILRKGNIMKKVVIIGAGPAGMTAAYSASQNGIDVVLVEKNERVGRKLLITGKGRCNITNNCEVEELIANVNTNGKFLYSAFYTFTNDAVKEMFESLGVRLKTERGNRVFPESDRDNWKRKM